MTLTPMMASQWMSTAREYYPLNVGLVRIGTYVVSYGAPGVPNRTQYPTLIAALEAALRMK